MYAHITLTACYVMNLAIFYMLSIYEYEYKLNAQLEIAIASLKRANKIWHNYQLPYDHCYMVAQTPNACRGKSRVSVIQLDLSCT